MDKKYARHIALSKGGYRERKITENGNFTIEKSETWNKDHKVYYIVSNETELDGYRNGFAYDIVTGSICG